MAAITRSFRLRIDAKCSWALLLLFFSVVDAQLTIEGPANNVFYAGMDSLVSLSLNLLQFPETAYNGELLLQTENLVTPDTAFVVPIEYADLEDLSTPRVCLMDSVAIDLFKTQYLLPCDLRCRRAEALYLEVMREFAGNPDFEDVLTRNSFPSTHCLLGPKFTTPTFRWPRMQRMMRDLMYISKSLSCNRPTLVKPGMGCDMLTIAAAVNGSDPIPYKINVAIEVDAFVSETTPNLPPALSGEFGATEIEVSKEISVAPLTLTDPDADFVTVLIETTGLVRLSLLFEDAPEDPTIFEEPEFVADFFDGAFNTQVSRVFVNVTLVQAQRLLTGLYFQADTLGMHSVTITVNDQGRNGFPAIDTVLSDSLAFEIEAKPSNIPPVVRFVNSDETWRFDWRPGVEYLKGGQNVTIAEEMFPCGGDTVDGRFDFPRDGSGEGDLGWEGSLPLGESSSAELRRNCREKPAEFWKEGERAIYVTLDEGGKGRAFVQMEAGGSGCNSTRNWMVTMSIQNANLSRTDIPAAVLTGYSMDWFECKSGAWYCARRNPRFSLDNSQGAVDRLTFHYDQEHRHLGTGYNDYRMTFSGDMADVQAAIRNITVEFPWLDTAYDGSEYIPPWPFKSWPRTGRSLLGSNILKIRIQDLHSEYAYDMIEHRLWYPVGLYRMALLASPQDAMTACSADLTCYGFQWLTFAQRQGVLRQKQIPSVGLGDTAGKPSLSPTQKFLAGLGFSDRPPTNWGLGDTEWDGLPKTTINWDTVGMDTLPNAYFFRKPFPEVDIEPYTFNAMTYTKRTVTSLCLGPVPYAEQLLDIRVLSEPINTPPVLTAEKPNWRIQRSYEFDLPGIKLYDEDAWQYGGDMLVSLSATRGAFQTSGGSGLTYLVGTGNGDPLLQTFLCKYRQCQLAIASVRYRSADEAGTDTVTVRVDDLGNSGELGSRYSQVSVTLSLASGPYNIPPTVDIPGLPARVTAPGERVDITGITVFDLDVDKPRWDKLRTKGNLTITVTIGTGYFDITRLRKHGLAYRNIVLGPQNGAVDTDCPCLTNTSLCPCNNWILTQYAKFTGLAEDIQWAVAEISVWKFTEGDTRLTVVVDDNCNTGFSDDSGQQRPCLTDTSSVVIRVSVPADAPTFIYTHPTTGTDSLFGMFEAVGDGWVTLGQNASAQDDQYTGLLLSIIQGTGNGNAGTITAYNASSRRAWVRIGVGAEVDLTSVYRIACGGENMPCRTLGGVIDATADESVILVGPGVYSGERNMALQLVGRTLEFRSTHGFNDTVVDCGGRGYVADFHPETQSKVLLQGFSFRNCGRKAGGAMAFRVVGQERVASVELDGSATPACQGVACTATPVVRECFFYNNWATSMGGALIIKGGRPKFEDCIFFSNSGNAGGAVYIRGGAAIFSRCVFYGNVADTGGGAVVVNGGRTEMKDCRFSMNAATTNGGAISMLNGELELERSEFVNNYAGGVDGGVHMANGRATMMQCVEDGNSEGTHASSLLEDIQTRRQQSHYTFNGLLDPYVYRDPLVIHDG